MKNVELSLILLIFIDFQRTNPGVVVFPESINIGIMVVCTENHYSYISALWKYYYPGAPLVKIKKIIEFHCFSLKT